MDNKDVDQQLLRAAMAGDPLNVKAGARCRGECKRKGHY